MQKENSTNSEENKNTEEEITDNAPKKVKSSGSNNSDQLFKTPQELSEENKTKDSKSKDSDEDKIEKPKV